jgi:predicted ATPase/class 3 adenylate cyclase
MVKPFCIDCRVELPQDSRFCFKCGTQVGSTNAANVRSVSPANILQSPVAVNSSTTTPISQGQACNIAGERKFVSVIFADISGFTAMSEKLDAERVTDIMNQCFKRLGKAVSDREGFIDKFMGDCIMALFGAPIAHENDPELAVACALQMLEEMKAFNAELGLEMGISIGINAGFVVAGGVGTSEKLEYTVMGDAVNLAQRLQSAAKRNEIYVSESIYKACPERFAFKKLEPMSVKGKSEPVLVYSVLGEAKDETESSSVFRDLSIVGRERELSVAENAFKELAQGRSQILMLAGDPGVGKSRMKFEMRKISQDYFFRWVEGRCTPLQRETSHSVVIHLIRNLLQIAEREELKSQREKLMTLKSLDLDNLSIQLIADFLSIPLEKEEPLKLEPQQKRKALWVALRQVFARMSQSSPVVLFFEDLQWVDRLSQEFISHLMDHLTTMKVMVAGGFRREFQHQWSQKPNFSQISLNPLTADQSVSYVKALLGVEQLPSELEALVHQKSDGNPLYIQEIIKTLIDTGKIKNISGTWTAVGDLNSLEISPTVQGLIASRIDRLDERSKQILQYASAIGRRFSDRVLRAALESSDDLDDRLQLLQHRGLIESESESSEEALYKFHHALMQDVAYQSILQKFQKVIHEQIGKSIESVHHQAIENYLEALAFHYGQSKNFDKSVEYLRRAGKKAAALFDNQTALKYYYQAAQLLESQVQQNPQNPDPRLSDIYFLISDVAILMGEFDSAVSYQEKLIEIGRAKNDLSHLCKSYRRYGDILRMRGQQDKAIDLLHLSLDYALRANDFEGQVRTQKAIGNTYLRLNQLDKALEILEQGRNGAQSLQSIQLLAEFNNDIATVYIERQQWDLAKTALEESIRVSSEDPLLKPLRATATLNLGVAYYYQKDYLSCMAKFKEAAKLQEETGNLVPLGTAKNNFGHALMEFQRYEEAIAEFESAKRIAESIGNDREVLHNAALIGFLKTKLGKPSEGEAELRDVLNRLASIQAWFWYVDALVYLATFLAESGRFSESKEAFDLASQKADEINNSLLRQRVIDEMTKFKDQIETVSASS